MAERLFRNQQIVGSIPTVGSKRDKQTQDMQKFDPLIAHNAGVV